MLPMKRIEMKPLFPTPALQRGSQYRPSDHTNIQDTWKKHGWQPKKRNANQRKAPQNNTVA